MKTRAALAAVQTLVAEELQLTLRAAIVPVRDIRANGYDVRLARFQVGADAFFAMFSGGGASWAEQEMKAGRYTVKPAPPGTRPDLTGLSCRWRPIEARHGEILSMIAIPGPNAASLHLPNSGHSMCENIASRRRGRFTSWAAQLPWYCLW